MIIPLVVFSTLIVVGAWAQNQTYTYDGYTVLRATPQNEEDLEFFKSLRNESGFSFWLEPSFVNNTVELMIAPDRLDFFNKKKKEYSFTEEILVENVKELIETEQKQMLGRKREMDWYHYHDLGEFENWMRNLERRHRDVVKRKIIGNSYEGRDIMALEITFNDCQPTVFIESGAHAREWISPAATSYFVNELLRTRRGSNLRRFNYVYVPILNPDGYAYTWTRDRFWLKTRKPYRSYGKDCYGSDLNLNFDEERDTFERNPCTNSYAGPNPFSEPEARALRAYFSKYQEEKDIAIYLSFHSYGRRLLYPYAKDGRRAPNAGELRSIGNLIADDLRRETGFGFTVDTYHNVIGSYRGTTLDYFYSKYNIELSYLFQFSTTKHKPLIVPPSQIKSSGRQVKVIIERLLKEYWDYIGNFKSKKN